MTHSYGGKMVLVTGGSGFIAGHGIMNLLQLGRSGNYPAFAEPAGRGLLFYISFTSFNRRFTSDPHKDIYLRWDRGCIREKCIGMKKQIYLVSTVLLLAASAFTFIHVQTWKIVEVYTVKFDTGIHSGEFRGLKGTISFDEKNLDASKFAVTIDPATINTGNGMKNKEAKGPNWLDVEKYPLISFTSSSIASSERGYEARGTLDLRGVKKEIVMPFTFNNSTFTSTFTIDRKDYSLYDWTHEKGSSLMEVSLSVPVVKP